MVRSVIALIGLVFLSACASQPVNRDTSIPLQSEASLDLTRYQGLWYEIARFPNSFERGCQGVTAQYTLREDGLIRVVNTCRKGSPDGPARDAVGKAKVAGANGAQLKVKFAPSWVPFGWGDYWVLDIDEAYSSVLVGEPSGKYLWILAREKTLSPERYSELIATAQRFGYNTQALETVDH